MIEGEAGCGVDEDNGFQHEGTKFNEDDTKAVTLQPAGTPANGRRRCESKGTESKARDMRMGIRFRSFGLTPPRFARCQQPSCATVLIGIHRAHRGIVAIVTRT